MDNKEKIINVAQNLIQTQGLDSFSFRTLAQEVEIKSASVHYYFPRKEDLIAEISKRYNENFFKKLQELQDMSQTTKFSIHGLVNLFIQTSKQEKMCLCGMLAANGQKLDELSKENTQSFFQNLKKWVRNILDTGRKKNELKSQLSSRELANILVSLLEGALLLDNIEGKSKNLDSAKNLIKEICH